MPTLTLSPIASADLDELLAFELVNRAYFEANINARPQAYYTPDGVSAAIGEAVNDARKGKAFQYLVRNERGELVARANLTQVKRAHFHSAELGYRVAGAETGKGIASEAVRLVLLKAFHEHGLVRVEATARPENIGSVQVLRRNGFVQFGRSTRSFELGGAWFDRLYFERHDQAG
ncbi:MAG: GNAT family N-acetyltransferase [Burkholderiaceae bacterium]|nr:GNAT family N-acetyltransferase [Burkholderiaceae bacterium]